MYEHSANAHGEITLAMKLDVPGEASNERDEATLAMKPRSQRSYARSEAKCIRQSRHMNAFATHAMKQHLGKFRCKTLR